MSGPKKNSGALALRTAAVAPASTRLCSDPPSEGREIPDILEVGRLFDAAYETWKLTIVAITNGYDGPGHQDRLNAAKTAAELCYEIARSLDEINLQPETLAGARIYSRMIRGVAGATEIDWASRETLVAGLGQSLANFVLEGEPRRRQLCPSHQGDAA